MTATEKDGAPVANFTVRRVPPEQGGYERLGDPKWRAWVYVETGDVIQLPKDGDGMVNLYERAHA